MVQALPVPLFLAYGDRRLELLTSAGYGGIRQQAEQLLSLHPEAYDLYDAHGKVEEETFERFLACSKGFCLLQLREKPEWQKIREIEARLQKLEEPEKKAPPQASSKDSDVGFDIEERLQTLEKLLHDAAQQTQFDALAATVAALEREMTEHAVTSSALNGHLECGLATAQKELESLRMYASDQLKSLDDRLAEFAERSLVEKVEQMEAAITEQAITSSVLNGHLECGLTTAQKELKGLREFTSKQLGLLDERLVQCKGDMDVLEANLAEQAVTNSAMNGHLECGVQTSKQELQSLRAYAADQFKFLNERLDSEKPTDIWSDGFKNRLVTKPSLKSLKPLAPLVGSHPCLQASKSLPQLALR
ncbi:unnamed protein product [Symbiodinium necroappetens]|uniref:Uncharacterized protein n=1 Tax=Symbiodinium necroappetens TaxID=1628268 RepID=A0A812RCY5_9DINO|nr:unnamed protein product [Symbiodinium necroappetens]